MESFHTSIKKKQKKKKKYMYCIFYRPNRYLGKAVITVIDSCPNTAVPSLKAVGLGSHFSIQWRVIYKVIIQILLQIRTLMREEAQFKLRK